MHEVTDAVMHVVSGGPKASAVAAVSCRCPVCGERQRFTFVEPLTVKNRYGPPQRQTCGEPACTKPLFFYVVDKPTVNPRGWLWMHPDPAAFDVPDPVMESLLTKVGPVAVSAYQQAVSTLRHGAADASATMSRKVLEALVKHELREGGQEVRPRETLGPLLKKLGEDTDRLARPLLELAEAITWVANDATHVDLDVEPPARRESAAKLLTLVSQIATYLLDTPGQAAALKASLDEDREAVPDSDG